jgi:hypothetical protein
MAKHERLHEDRQVTLKINDQIKKRLAALADDGMFGNVYEEVALIALRAGIKELERQERKARQLDLELTTRNDDRTRNDEDDGNRG